ncbi:hypothetical protein [Aquimarina sp. RZ0]|uniref:hypothetical protein n=1 Tax=Aquimarina sp. RZ0 TaxID=2607730 RepID=UPI0011F20D5B|nr:hypothetical protein [Aquimarina sp. RZ0]KAA1247921.1 hypothetical protein F0000_01495 [Aquimarina sp. RZ0]
MAQKEIKKDVSFERLNKFLRQNKKIDWQTINLVDKKVNDTLNWKGVEDSQEDVLKKVKGYQRMVRVLGEDNPKIIKALLKKNIHSAIQIAAMTQKHFINECSKIFKNDDEYIKEVHKKAVAIRSKLLVRYVEHTQNKEPHVQQVKTL